MVTTGRHFHLGLAFVAGVAAGVVGAVVGIPALQPRLPVSWPWYVWAIASTSGLLWLVAASWDKAPGVAMEPTPAERTGIGLVCTFGAIGRLVRWLHLLFTEPNKDYDASFLLLPLESAALALIAVLLLRAGLIGPTAGEHSKAVNWLGLYATAALTGLFAQEVIPKLATLFAALFGPGARKSLSTM